MSYEDRTLSCQECGQPFTFTADDQQYHAEKGYTNDPKRCTTCRQARRNDRSHRRFLAAAAVTIEARRRCILRSAPTAARTPQFPSSPGVTARSTVAIATVSEAVGPAQAGF